MGLNNRPYNQKPPIDPVRLRTIRKSLGKLGFAGDLILGMYLLFLKLQSRHKWVKVAALAVLLLIPFGLSQLARTREASQPSSLRALIHVQQPLAAYNVTDIGLRPGYENSTAYGINAMGQVVVVACNEKILEDAHSYVWQAGKWTDLGSLGGSQGS